LHDLKDQSVAALRECERDTGRGWRGAMFDGQIELAARTT